jgi:hypothetical protein
MFFGAHTRDAITDVLPMVENYLFVQTVIIAFALHVIQTITTDKAAKNIKCLRI